MSSMIDAVLSPYADDQPKYLDTQETNSLKYIERIPRLVDSNGNIIAEFQIFYNCLVKYICEGDIDGLYELSDKSITKQQFCDSYREAIGSKISEIQSTRYNNRGIDLEVNLKRFEEKHRNLIGGIYVMIYSIKSVQFDGINSSPALEQMFTEILFTYKKRGFCIVSVFTPFKNCLE